MGEKPTSFQVKYNYTCTYRGQTPELKITKNKTWAWQGQKLHNLTGCKQKHEIKTIMVCVNINRIVELSSIMGWKVSQHTQWNVSYPNMSRLNPVHNYHNSESNTQHTMLWFLGSYRRYSQNHSASTVTNEEKMMTEQQNLKKPNHQWLNATKYTHVELMQLTSRDVCVN